MQQVKALSKFVPNVGSGQPQVQQEADFELIPFPEIKAAPPAAKPPQSAGAPINFSERIAALDEYVPFTEEYGAPASEGIGGFFGPLERGLTRNVFSYASNVVEFFGAHELGKSLLARGEAINAPEATGRYARPIRSLYDDPLGSLDDMLDVRRIWQELGENVPVMGAVALGGLLGAGAGFIAGGPPGAVAGAGAGARILYGLLEGGDIASDMANYEDETGEKINPILKRSLPIAVGVMNSTLGMSGIDSILKGLKIPGLRGKLIHTILAGGVEGATELGEEFVQATGQMTYREVPWPDVISRLQSSFYSGLAVGTGISVGLTPFGARKKGEPAPPPDESPAMASDIEQATVSAAPSDITQKMKEQEQLKKLEELAKPVNKTGDKAVAKVREASLVEKPVKTITFMTEQGLDLLGKAQAEFIKNPTIRGFFDSPEDLAESWAASDALVNEAMTRRAINETSSVKKSQTSTEVKAEGQVKPRPKKPERRSLAQITDEMDDRLSYLEEIHGDAVNLAAETDEIFQRLKKEASDIEEATLKQAISEKAKLDGKSEEQAAQDLVSARLNASTQTFEQQLQSLNDKITSFHTHVTQADINLIDLTSKEKESTSILEALNALERKAPSTLKSRIDEAVQHFIASVNVLGEARRRLEAESARAALFEDQKKIERETTDEQHKWLTVFRVLGMSKDFLKNTYGYPAEFRKLFNSMNEGIVNAIKAGGEVVNNINLIIESSREAAPTVLKTERDVTEFNKVADYFVKLIQAKEQGKFQAIQKYMNEQGIIREERAVLTEAEQAPIVQRLKQLFPFLKFEGPVLPLIASRDEHVFGANINHGISWVADGARDDTVPHEAFHDLLLLLLAHGDGVAQRGLELARSQEQLVQWVGEEYAHRNAGDYVSSRQVRLRQWLREFWSRIKELFLSARLNEQDVRNLLGKAFYEGTLLERVGLNAQTLKHEALFEADETLANWLNLNKEHSELVAETAELASLQDPSLKELDGEARALGIPVDVMRKAKYQSDRIKIMEGNEGFKLVEKLTGDKGIYDRLKPEQVSPFASYFGSSEYQLLRKGFTRAAGLVGKVIERSLLHSFQARQDVAGFNLFRSGKLKVAHPEKLRWAVQQVYNNNADKIPEFNLRNAAEGLVRYFKEIRDAYVESRLEILQYKTVAKGKPWLVVALKRLMEGAEPVNLVAELGIKNKKDIRTLTALYRRFNNVRHWGIDEFITNIEPGRFSVVDLTGSIIGVSETYEGAVKLARKFLERPGVQLTETKDENGNVKFVKSEFEELEVAISTDIRPPSPDQARLNKLKGRDNLLEVMDIYASRMRKIIALDPIYEQIKFEMAKNPNEFPESVAKIMHRTMRDAKGNYWLGDQILDSFLDRKLPKVSAVLNKEGRAYSRLVSGARLFTTNIKLGYRVIAPTINFLGGTFQHTWAKVGSRYLVEAVQFVRSGEGRQLIKDEELYLGRGRIVEEMEYQYERVQLWKPLGLFQKAEKINVEIGFAANYLMARRDYKMDDVTAREHARRAIRFQQFVYNVASLPPVLRSPTGRIIGQFKTYLIKEIEFINSLRGKEIPRYLAATFAIGGLRGVTYAIKTVPLIWLMGGLLGQWDKWLNSMPKDAPQWARTMRAFVQRGVPGLFGGDVAAPAVIQLPQEPEELLGPFIGDVLAFFGDVVKPIFQGQGYALQDFAQLVRYKVPALNYFWQVTDTFIGDGKLYDSAGRPLYDASYWDRFLLATGVTPANKSREDAIARMLKDEEATRQARVFKAQNAFFAHVMKHRSVGDFVSWLSSDSFNDVMSDLVAAGALESLEQNAKFRFIPRETQQILKARVLNRAHVIESWPGQQ